MIVIECETGELHYEVTLYRESAGTRTLLSRRYWVKYCELPGGKTITSAGAAIEATVREMNSWTPGGIQDVFEGS